MVAIQTALLAVMLFLALAHTTQSQSSPAPIIGVFTQVWCLHARTFQVSLCKWLCADRFASEIQAYGSDPLPAYIAASYVKYLESAGARVVPIFYDSPLETLTTMFSQVNGILVCPSCAVLAVA
jgi:hypothetical protein